MKRAARSAPNSAKIPLGGVRIVEEEDQVTEADQRIGASSGSSQCIDVAVHVADHMQTHEVSR